MVIKISRLARAGAARDQAVDAVTLGFQRQGALTHAPAMPKVTRSQSACSWEALRAPIAGCAALQFLQERSLRVAARGRSASTWR